MKIDFTKLQKLFIEKIKKEEHLILRAQDVSFKIKPNYESERYNLSIRFYVFDEEFSLGYPNESSTEAQLINDCYSRLHDYSTDDPKSHIISLKVQELEKRYAEQIRLFKERMVNLKTGIKAKEISLEIDDSTLGEIDERGFPKFELSVYIKGKQVLKIVLGFTEYDHKLVDKLEQALIE